MNFWREKKKHSKNHAQSRLKGKVNFQVNFCVDFLWIFVYIVFLTKKKSTENSPRNSLEPRAASGKASAQIPTKKFTQFFHDLRPHRARVNCVWVAAGVGQPRGGASGKTPIVPAGAKADMRTQTCNFCSQSMHNPGASS